LLAYPIRGSDQTIGQEFDIEHFPAIDRFPLGEQIEEQRGKTGLVQHGSDKAITGTVTTAAAAVGEHHDPPRLSPPA